MLEDRILLKQKFHIGPSIKTKDGKKMIRGRWRESKDSFTHTDKYMCTFKCATQKDSLDEGGTALSSRYLSDRGTRLLILA